MSTDRADPSATIRDDIMFVVGTLQVGGSERHLSTIARALTQRGRRISIYCLSGGGPLHAELEQGGVTVLLPIVERHGRTASLVFRVLRLSLAASHLFSVMLRRRPAIVHFFLPEAYLTGAPLAALAGLPLRVMSRRSLNLYQRRRPFLGRIERRLHRWMTAVLGNSASVVRELKDEGIAADRLGLIYNGIEQARMVPRRDRAAMRASLGLAQDTVVMAIVANLISYKGHRDLLSALAGMRGRLPADWRVLVVGRDDGIEPDLRAQAESLGLTANISFLGPRHDVADLLGASDVGILCSHEEGFSNSVLEGMAAGLPMVVTDVGGNAEAVIDGECGWVVPSRDPQRLGEAIVMLAGDAALRAQFGAAGRRRIEERFTLGRCVDAYDAFYSELRAGKLPRDIAAIHPELR